MSSTETTLAEGPETIDLDLIIRNWGSAKLGAEVDKVDASDVRVSQLSVIYQSDKDWFNYLPVHSEIFDNSHDDGDSTWRYSHTAKFSSQASWRIMRGYKTTLLNSPRVAVDFPVAEDGKRPLRGTFESPQAEQTTEAKGGEAEWAVEAEVNVKPLTTTKATTEVRVCRLKEVKFMTDIVMHGLIKFHISSKKASKLGKSADVSASIEEILGSNPVFSRFEERPGSDVGDDTYGTSNKKLCYRVEGFCTGIVGLGASVRLSEVQSLV